jgi:hypothetical protein
MGNTWETFGESMEKIKYKKYRRNMGKILETDDFTRRS